MMNYLAFLVPYGKVSDSHPGVPPIFCSCHRQCDGQFNYVGRDRLFEQSIVRCLNVLVQ